MTDDSKTDSLFEKFIEHLQSHPLFDHGDRILLTVSGGVDSVVMAELFHRANMEFGIAHCNFQLRGGDSMRDQNFVENLAEKYGVPLHLATFETSAYAKENKLSIEEAARELRYRFFEETRRNFRYEYIATAHHNNDSIETFFINLLRGTGIAGLHGIRPKHGHIIRPLLPFTRAEILDFAGKNKIDFCEDYTNSDTVFLRNKIRHNLIPLMKEISPAFERTMRKNIEHLAEVESIYKDSVKEMQERIFRHSDNKVTIQKDDIRKLNPPHAYLFEMLRPYGFNSATTENLLQMMDGTSGKMFRSESHTLLVDRGEIILKPIGNDTASEILIDKDIASIKEPIFLTFNNIHTEDLQNPKTAQNEILVDGGKLRYPLKLRKWKTGDRFKPFGMKGSRKVSDFFKDQHLSLFEKEEKWLLCNADDRIIWIVGMRMDDSFKITSDTKEVLKIKNDI